MTDFEMTVLAAQAMGFDLHERESGVLFVAHPNPQYPRTAYSWFHYAPLKDDAQAMALVKRFHIHCIRKDDSWWANREGGLFSDGSLNPDLNRAIVECIAASQLRPILNSVPKA